MHKTGTVVLVGRMGPIIAMDWIRMDKSGLSNSWDWESVKDIERWNEPSEEGHHYANVWSRNRNGSVLDLGCGLGRHSILFASHGLKVTAFDSSEYAVDELRKRASELDLDIRCDVGDMHSLPYDDGSFDHVFAYLSISHTDSEGIRKVISEIGRVLVPNGTVFLTLCSKDTWSFKEANLPIIDACTRVRLDGPEKGIPHVYVDVNDIRELFSEFELIRVRHIDDCLVEGRWQNSKHFHIEAMRTV